MVVDIIEPVGGFCLRDAVDRFDKHSYRETIVLHLEVERCLSENCLIPGSDEVEGLEYFRFFGTIEHECGGRE